MIDLLKNLTSLLRGKMIEDSLYTLDICDLHKSNGSSIDDMPDHIVTVNINQPGDQLVAAVHFSSNVPVPPVMLSFDEVEKLYKFLSDYKAKKESNEEVRRSDAFEAGLAEQELFDNISRASSSIDEAIITGQEGQESHTLPTERKVLYDRNNDVFSLSSQSTSPAAFIAGKDVARMDGIRSIQVMPSGPNACPPAEKKDISEYFSECCFIGFKEGECLSFETMSESFESCHVDYISSFCPETHEVVMLSKNVIKVRPKE